MRERKWNFVAKSKKGEYAITVSQINELLMTRDCFKCTRKLSGAFNKVNSHKHLHLSLIGDCYILNVSNWMKGNRRVHLVALAFAGAFLIVTSRESSFQRRREGRESWEVEKSKAKWIFFCKNENRKKNCEIKQSEGRRNEKLFCVRITRLHAIVSCERSANEWER